MTVSGGKQYYIPTELPGIGKTLEGLFAAPEDAESRASHTNLVIIAAQEDSADDLQGLVETFALVYPSRIFVISVRDEYTEVKAEVAACCHIVSGNQKVCSEVVRLLLPKAEIEMIPGLLRANLLGGVRCELFIYSAATDKDVLRSVAVLCDRIIFDSQEFESCMGEAFAISDLAPQTIDLEWHRLRTWRDELKGVFAKPSCQEFLPQLERIEIVAGSRDERSIAPGALLLGGWLMECLQLTVEAYGASGYECRGQNGQEILCALVPRVLVQPIDGQHVPSYQAPPRYLVEELTLYFRVPGAGVSGEGAYVYMKRGRLLETVVQLGQSYKVSRAFEDETQAGIIQRYFAVGGVTMRYAGVMKAARDLEYLRSGFSRL